jgi:pyridoxine kinase
MESAETSREIDRYLLAGDHRAAMKDIRVSVPTRNAIISISSHVMRGSVGNRAAAFALETLGHAVWSVPTVILPWHPGQGRATRIKLDSDGFSAALHELATSKWRGEVAAILTGYFADAGQVRAAADLIRAFRQANADIPYLCDPVIGDHGGLYVAQDVATAIRDELLPLASMATPNRFELGWLTQMPVETNAQILDAAAALDLRQTIVTSAHAMMAGSIANLLAMPGKAVLVEHRALETAPNGLGDLLSALYLSHTLAGAPPQDALQKAAASVFEIATRSVKQGSDELLLETETAAMRTPMAAVTIRNIIVPSSAKPRKTATAVSNDHSG